MRAHFLADGLVNHKSTKSSLMQNSQTVARGDGEVLQRDRKMCTIVSVASRSNGSWEKNSPLTVQITFPWRVLEFQLTYESGVGSGEERQRCPTFDISGVDLETTPLP